MAELSRAALSRALRNRLGGLSELWVGRVYLRQAPASVTRPYVVYNLPAGGESNEIKGEDAEYIVTAKCVSNKLDEAFRGAARISELLNDKGQQESPSDYLDVGPNWIATTITKGLAITMTENVENSVQIYHEGDQYRIRMERL